LGRPPSPRRGTRGLDCRFFARHGLAACRTRRGRPPRLLGDIFEDPAAAHAAGGPGPAEEAEGREALQNLLARLPSERMRQAVRLRAEGLTVREAAARMRCCRQRVESLLQKARRLVCRGRGG
jgi:DNA-directed RNA polymerase specialized sigma24 family protein